MAVPTWQPGTLYQPGDIVQPITAPPPTAAQVENGDFAAGNVNWDFIGGAAFATSGGYSGNGNCVRMPGNAADGLALNRTKLVVPSTGSTFEASAMINQGASIRGATRGWVEVRWFDIDDAQLSAERGNIVDDGSGGAWHQSKVTATRPAGAAYARAGIGLFSVADHSHPIWGDNLAVSGTFAGLPDGLVYKAVQPESGFSASDEPAWPPLLGQQVIDNDVIWEAVASTRVTWEASPLYVSGNTEPVWPTDVGGFVRDGTINWKTVSRRVEDENCPNTKIVVIAASKVFAGDDDIVRYSATVNPLDWTSVDDAGYLPTGLQNYGSNPVAAMGLYRGNLVVFNAEAFQLWQVDEDPASMALIDALPLGSTQHRSIAPVSNDLFFGSSQGIRSIGIAASSTNYQAGDVGVPIDPLIEPLIRSLSDINKDSLGLFYPAKGQYWFGITNTAPPPPLPPPEITGAPPEGQMNVVYAYQFTMSGDFPAFTADEVDGSLPPGLEIDADGLLHGIPLASFNDDITLRVTDARGVFATKDFPLKIRGLQHWNVSDKATSVVLSDDDQIAEVVVDSATTAGGCVRGVQARSSGKFYVEFVWERFNASFSGYAGLLTGTGSLTTAPDAQASMSAGVRQTSQFNVGGTNTAEGSPPSQGARVGIAIDLDARRCWIHINGVWKLSQSPTSHPGGLLGAQTPAAPLYPVAFSNDDNTALSHKIRLVVEGSQMVYRPSGFTPWGGI